MPAFKFKIKSNSATSTTQQVADQIREAIETGRFKAGERLPSEMEIAEQLGMSRGVGKKAYRKLNGLGLFFNSGTGRIVADGGATAKRSTPPAKKRPAAKTTKSVAAPAKKTAAPPAKSAAQART